MDENTSAAGRPLRVGLVGWGAAATVFHAPLIAATPGLQLVAVATRDPARLAAVAGPDGRYPGLQAEPTPQALCARPDIDLVVVPTPNDTHHPIAAAALAAGKHVVVDKPFVLDTAQARDLIVRAQAAGRLLSVFQNRRWDADFLTLRALLAGGRLGRVVRMESRFDRFRPQVPQRWREAGGPGSGLWYDLGPHLVDQALQLFGLPQAVMLDLAVQRDAAVVDDGFVALLRYDGGLRVLLEATTLAAAPTPRWSVHGTAGSWVKFGLDPQEDAMKAGGVPRSAGWGAEPQPGTLTVPGDAAAGAAAGGIEAIPGDYVAYYANVRDAIRGAAPLAVPGEDGLRVMQVIEAGFVSAREGLAVDPATR